VPSIVAAPGEGQKESSAHRFPCIDDGDDPRKKPHNSPPTLRGTWSEPGPKIPNKRTFHQGHRPRIHAGLPLDPKGTARVFMPVSSWTPEPRSRQAVPMEASDEHAKVNVPTSVPTHYYASGHSVSIAEGAAASWLAYAAGGNA